MSEVREWDIGFVPKGWTRGDHLRIVPAPANGRGMVLRKDLPLGTRILPDDIAFVQFVYTDAPRVDSWLKWWKS